MRPSAQFQVLQQELHTAEQVMTTVLMLCYHHLLVQSQSVGNGSGFDITI